MTVTDVAMERNHKLCARAYVSGLFLGNVLKLHNPTLLFALLVKNRRNQFKLK